MPAPTDFTHSQQHAAPVEPAMTTLYRAALGPVRANGYLPRFERFDTLGRTTAGWNWAASLFTLSWMALRQLWTPALIYVAAAEGLGLLLFGAIRSMLPWPEPVQWGLIGAFALLAFALPGLYGDAILHIEIRKRIARTLASTRSLPEACAQLDKQAATPRRMAALAVLNAVLLAAAVVAYYFLPQGSPSEPEANPAVHAPPASAAPVPSIPAPASHPIEQPPAPPNTPASAPVESGASAGTPTDTAEATPPATPPLPPASAALDAAPAPLPAPLPAAKPAHADPAPKKSSRPKATAPVQPAPDPKPPTSAASAPEDPADATVGSAAGFYINVGLFAEEANARKAQAKLLNAALPAFRQSLNTPAGQRIRVRVGPYPNAQQAQQAARSIKAMGLDAVVFQQKQAAAKP